jgi:hypothetical protein
VFLCLVSSTISTHISLLLLPEHFLNKLKAGKLPP